MADQVQYVNSDPPNMQMGRPPGNGSTACTDNVGCNIVYREKGRVITPAQFRAASREDWVTGLTPAGFLRALLFFGVKGYRLRLGVTASQAIKASDKGVVCVGVGYRLYPKHARASGPGPDADIGGKTDVRFTGAHAVSLYGRRLLTVARVQAWRVYMRDSDHRQGHQPRFDRFLSRHLQPAMDAIKEDRWRTTFIISKG